MCIWHHLMVQPARYVHNPRIHFYCGLVYVTFQWRHMGVKAHVGLPLHWASNAENVSISIPFPGITSLTGVIMTMASVPVDLLWWIWMSRSHLSTRAPSYSQKDHNKTISTFKAHTVDEDIRCSLKEGFCLPHWSRNHCITVGNWYDGIVAT